MRQPRRQERLSRNDVVSNSDNTSIPLMTNNIKDTSFRIINWRLGNQLIIDVGRRNIVFFIDDRNPQEVIIVVMGEVIEERGENLKVVHLGSDLAEEIELDTKLSICDDQNLDPMITNILFWGIKGKSFKPYEYESGKRK